MATIEVQPAPSREGDATALRRRSSSISVERTHQLLVEQIILCVEQECGAGESLLQASGKAIYRRALELRERSSNGDVADHIFRGVTGYLFRSYRTRRGRLTLAVLRDFQTKVELAIRGGAGETRGMLVTFSSLSIGAERAILRTADSLRDKMEAWFIDRQADCEEIQ